MPQLIKLSDDIFDGISPIGVNNGFTINTDKPLKVLPTVGLPFIIADFKTIIVISIVEDTEKKCKFNTKNSTYVLVK